LARADGLAEKHLSPVPERLLKEAQQAAEEQHSMPKTSVRVHGEKHQAIPAGLEKIFKQAEAEQEVEKAAKLGHQVFQPQGRKIVEVGTAATTV
jgi:uncharacterized membrane protein